MLPIIYSVFPKEYKRFIEVFGGSGAVLLGHDPVDFEVYNDVDKPFGVDLIKMPHHGSYTETLYRFLRTFMPEYVVISVGNGNAYGHPHQKTLDLLNSKSWTPSVCRTDLDGDILARSNGKEISLETAN